VNPVSSQNNRIHTVLCYCPCRMRQSGHITKIIYWHNLVTVSTIAFITLVFLFVNYGITTRRAVSFQLTDGFFSAPHHTFLMVLEKTNDSKCLLHASHGILMSVSMHGGLLIQSLHIRSHTFVMSRLHPLLQEVQTYRLAIASS
jgi:hypothetical protein